MTSRPFDVAAAAAETVEEPRPDPVWADDPFGTPTTLAVCPWRSDPCDGGSLPREARR